MIEPDSAIRFLRQAADLNRQDPLLRGSMLHFPNYGQLVMTGDLHGHRRNFEKLRRYCCLEHSPARHVILHEIIHEEPETLDAPDRSYEVLADAAAWKCAFPEQVHFLQSNHELSQLTGHEIAKNGRVVTYEFDRSVQLAFGRRTTDMLDAIAEFISSLPLAARVGEDLFLSHSLPSPRDVVLFDPTVFDRTPSKTDLGDGGSAYLLVWGRYQTAVELDQLCQLLRARWFICGHQPQEDGYDVLHDRMLILASDHNHGVFLPIDLNKKPESITDLTSRIRPFAAVP